MTKITKTPSSLNQVAGIDVNRVKHLGRNFATIDFEIKDQVDPNEFKYAKMKPIIGTFVIGNRRIEVTYSELNHIMRTANDAANLCDQAYRMGKWGVARPK
tara:strand:- start:620 stop:922 length:303 start_codon:yes stop_codon:yes gene_type:complete